MMADLAALTPSLVVCAAFIVGVLLFLRHQLAPKRRSDKTRPDNNRRTDASGNRGNQGNDAERS